MNSSTPTSQPLRQSSSRLIVLQSFSKKASIAVTLIGGVVILGWIFDIALLKSVLPGLVSMKVNTALCFILGGVSLWLWHRQSATRMMRRVGLVCAILVLLIGLFTLIEYGFNLNFGIDQLLFKVSTIGVGEVAPGRMAVPSALNFLLLGLGLLLLSLGRRHYLPAQFFALFAFLIGFLGLLGYIYGNTYFYNVASFTSIAFHTTVAFLLLSLGILFARPDQGLMSIFISNHAGGLMARRLLPAAIALPPALCWLVLFGYNVKLYTAQMGICLLSILTIDIFAALIWSNQQLRGMEAQLRFALAQEKELSELKSRIITTISHEYRTPLTTISSSAELLEHYRHKWDDDKQLKHFGRIQSSIKHMTALVNDVLFLNQAEFGKLEFNPVPLNVADFFVELIDELQTTVGHKYNLSFTHQVKCCIQAYLDAKLLREIFTNLLSNAIKYSPDGGVVQIRLTCEERKLIFQVQDEGIGIPKEDQLNLFKSFSRASNVGTIAGTGLGLSIIKKCVDLHGGQIAVKSEVGVGTTFSVSLPLDRD
jgi:signal transduction histidine kinase